MGWDGVSICWLVRVSDANIKNRQQFDGGSKNYVLRDHKNVIRERELAVRVLVLAISRSQLGCMSGSSETVDGERAWPHSS